MVSHVSKYAGRYVLDDPIDSIQKTLTTLGTTRNDPPMTGSYLLQVQVVFDLGSCEATWNVLLVTEYQKSSSHELLFLEQAVKLLLGVFQSELVRTVDHPDDSVGLFEVVPPVGPDCPLPSNVPDVEFEVLILQSLDVKAECRGNLINVFPVELLDDGGLAGVVESQNKQSHLLLLLLGLLDDGHESHGI